MKNLLFFFPFRLSVLLGLFSDDLIVKLAQGLEHNNGHGVNSLLTARSVQIRLFFCQLFARQSRTATLGDRRDVGGGSHRDGDEEKGGEKSSGSQRQQLYLLPACHL